ncbi:hypothetical protein STENM223S_02333 [Streptomyces tendae]
MQLTAESVEYHAHARQPPGAVPQQHQPPGPPRQQWGSDWKKG